MALPPAAIPETDHGPFVAAMIAEPDADGPALVYADWLEECGDVARAEFVRVQIELANLPDFDARRIGLQERERALLEAGRARWIADLPAPTPLLERFAFRYHFERGFVRGVECHPHRLADIAGDLFARTPIRHVTLLTHNFLAPPPASRGSGPSPTRPSEPFEVETPYPIRSLRVKGRCEIEWFAHPGAADLETLDLRDTANLGAQRTADLAGLGRPLGKLRKLNLQGCRVGLRGARALAERAGETFPELRTLNLRANAMPMDALLALGKSSALGKLRELNLACAQVDDLRAEILMGLPLTGRLETLDLRYNALTSAGLERALDRLGGAGLKRLSLAGNPLDERGFRALADCEALRELEVLNLKATRLDSRTPDILLNSTRLGKLRALIAGDDLERKPKLLKLFRDAFGSRLWLESVHDYTLHTASDYRF